MDKTDLITLLKQEQDRVKMRIRRHEDVMSDSQLRELEARMDGLRFALDNARRLGAA